jgi:hypothetical protein
VDEPEGERRLPAAAGQERPDIVNRGEQDRRRDGALDQSRREDDEPGSCEAQARCVREGEGGEHLDRRDEGRAPGAEDRGPRPLGRSPPGRQEHHQQEQQMVEAERDVLHAEPEERGEAAPCGWLVLDLQRGCGGPPAGGS